MGVPGGVNGEELLALPEGFTYWSLGEVGSTMAAGLPTPAAQDGMAGFRDGRRMRLVRNHEVRGASATTTVGNRWPPGLSRVPV